MSTRVEDRVDDWDEQSFTGGYRELQELSGQRFSGVVRAGGAELYMTKGVAVGILQGSIEDFEDATGTAFRAPSPALPVLAVMQDRSDGVRDKFYTEKTPIEDVDSKLASAGFTGYIELSENVLSGDYYLVYHGGESMSVAFVGESSRLIDADEAFETANDEVGIYKVRQVDLEPVELPEPADPEPADPESADAEPTGESAAEAQDGDAAEDGQTGGESTTAGDATGADAGDATDTSSTAGPTGDPAATTGGEEQPVADTSSSPRADQSGGRAGDEGGETAEASGGETVAPHRREEAGGGQQAAGRPQEPADTRAESAEGRTGQSGPDQPGGSQQPPGTAAGSGKAAASAGNQRESAQQRKKREPIPEGSLDLETRAIPSLDPGRTVTVEQEQPEPDVPGRGSDAGASAGANSQPAGQPAGQRETARQRDPASQQPDAGAREPASDERIEALEADLAEREKTIEELEADLEKAEADREELQAELESVTAERDELAEELEELEAELTRLETELGATRDAEERMTPSEALRGTDVFIRYHSKGEQTLEKAHGSSTDREAVNENLRLEKHTQFDKGSVAVGGQAYADFLESTVEYQFVEWMVRELLFEIRDTGHKKQLKDLYDVLPQIDRAELAGVVEVTYMEDGEEQTRQEAFDVVLRNRMGNPLLVANLNDSREAATDTMMEDLITSAERVGKGADTFAGAFMVTTSFFEPGALEIASEATQGGILSRDKRKSFVNLSRKRGYHLCLVEARNENFHLAVPEL